MCTTCGCGQDEVRVTTVDQESGRTPTHSDGGSHSPVSSDGDGDPQVHGGTTSHPHVHSDGVSHSHTHHFDHEQARAHAGKPVVNAQTQTLILKQQILAKNDALATGNRDWLGARGIAAVNLMSSPGAGKTSLLERTIRELAQAREITVIEGDQETLIDAERIRDAGARAVQVNTGAGCHLDAAMVRVALDTLEPSRGSLVMVENVGNLVCPALFDIGELRKVVVISVTEGDDKPLKYPHMFAAADLVVINKVDLLPYVDFDTAACTGHARSVNPAVTIMPLSVTTGEGLGPWYEWLRNL